jgi:hypothetical protein
LEANFQQNREIGHDMKQVTFLPSPHHPFADISPALHIPHSQQRTVTMINIVACFLFIREDSFAINLLFETHGCT